MSADSRRASRLRLYLRTAALAWMTKNRFFEPEELGVSKMAVFFESTRREKLERIARLGCTHFIDDMEETFLEPLFPKNTAKILYHPADPLPVCGREVRVVRSWDEVGDDLFHG